MPKKKIRGQGQRQPFRGQTLSRLRTKMLDAKTKDTGASALHQKKVFKNFFQVISKRANLKICKFSAKILAFSNKILTVEKIALSLSQGQGNFLGQGLLNVSSRTSSKQGRSRGLHLCYRYNQSSGLRCAIGSYCQSLLFNRSF